MHWMTLMETLKLVVEEEDMVINLSFEVRQ
jgi:hypothetical protein